MLWGIAGGFGGEVLLFSGSVRDEMKMWDLMEGLWDSHREQRTKEEVGAVGSYGNEVKARLLLRYESADLKTFLEAKVTEVLVQDAEGI